MEYREKYEQALDIAKETYDKQPMYRDWLEKMFPELAESEDEKIRKELMDFAIKANNGVTSILANNYHFDKWLTWLEKQGKQNDSDVKDYNSIDPHFGKSIDKIEPKFKVGDWIILTVGELSTTLQIVNVDTNKKLYWFNDSSYLPIVDEECLHLWTIQDAKDGDVLCSPCLGLLWIFKSRDTVYCGYNPSYNNGSFCGEGHFERPTDAIPATKEQRDLLFKKIKEAGYEWDADKKELKKIEQKPAWSEDDDTFIAVNNPKAYRIGFADGESHAREEMATAWSEEDEDMIQALDACIDAAIKSGMNYISFDSKSILIGKVKNWLKSIKDRVQLPPKQEWSEEDSIRLQRIIDFLWYNRKGDTYTIYQQEQDIDWLKSFRPQNH